VGFPGFRAEVAHEGGLASLRVFGELDLATADPFSESVTGLLETSPSHAVIDLRGVSFMDSTGLRCVLHANGLAEQKGIELAIVRGPRQVAEVFRLAGLDQHLPLVDEPPKK